MIDQICRPHKEKNGLKCSIGELYYSYLEPQTTSLKWMFGETTVSYVKIWNDPIERMFGKTTISYVKIWNDPIETTIYKWLFWLPAITYHSLPKSYGFSLRFYCVTYERHLFFNGAAGFLPHTFRCKKSSPTQVEVFGVSMLDCRVDTKFGQNSMDISGISRGPSPQREGVPY